MDGGGRRPRSRTQTLRAGVATSFLGRAFPPLAALVTAPLLAAGLGVSGRGELAAAVAPLLLAASIAPIGVPAAVTFAVARSPALLARAARRGSLLVAAAGLVATVVAVGARDWLAAGDAAIAQGIALAALAIVPTVIIAVAQAAAAGHGRWRLISAERILGSAVKVAAIAMLFAFDELTVVTAVIVTAFAPVVGGLVYLGMRAPASQQADGARYRELARYGLRFWFGAVAGIMLIRLDQLLFVPVGGAYQLGLYAVAVTIAEAPLVINAAVRDVVFTHDAARADDELLARASRLSTLATAAVAVVIAATAWWWLPILFGEAFAAALPALLILLVAVVAGNPGSVAGTGLAARDRPGMRSASLAIACAVNIGIFLLLVPVWGAVGAAIATLAGNLAASNANLLLLRHASGTPISSFYAFRRDDVRSLLAMAVHRLRRKAAR